MITIVTEIKDMKSWDEAEKWLSKHGWGPELIAQQKEAWDAIATPAPIVATTIKPEVKKSVKKITIKK